MSVTIISISHQLTIFITDANKIFGSYIYFSKNALSVFGQKRKMAERFDKEMAYNGV